MCFFGLVYSAVILSMTLCSRSRSCDPHLQRVQHALARIVMQQSTRFSPLTSTSLLQQLHWLPVGWRITLYNLAQPEILLAVHMLTVISRHYQCCQLLTILLLIGGVLPNKQYGLGTNESGGEWARRGISQWSNSVAQPRGARGPSFFPSIQIRCKHTFKLY